MPPIIKQNMAEKQATKMEEKAKALMKKLNVPEVYSNSKKEFFTSFNLAVNSEGGDASKIKTYK